MATQTDAESKESPSKPKIKKEVEITDDTVKLYVGGIDPGWSSSKILEILSKYGKVKRADVVKNFAFAFVDSQEIADTIIKEVSGKTFDNQKIVVQISKNKQNLPECDDLCFECGKGGHWARECSQRRARMHSRGGRGPPDRDLDDGYSRDYPPERGYGSYPRERDPYMRDYPPRSYERDMYRRDPFDRDPYRSYERDPYGSSSYDRYEPVRSYSYRERSPPPRYSYRRSPPPARSSYGRESDPYAANRERLAYGRGSHPDSAPRSTDAYAPVASRADPYESARRAVDPYDTARRPTSYETASVARSYSAYDSAAPVARSSYYDSATPSARSAYSTYDSAASAARSAYSTYDSATTARSAYDGVSSSSAAAAADPYAMSVTRDRYASDSTAKRYPDPAYPPSQRVDY